MTTNIERFLKHLRTKCESHVVKYQLPDKRYVIHGGIKCNGFFTDTPEPMLSCAMAQPEDQWLRLLVHESCHMDQWLERSPLWFDDKVNGTSALELIDKFLADNKEVMMHVLIECIYKAIDLEKDCEKRSLKKMIDFDLPVDLGEYARKANAYLLFYLTIPLTGEWYEIGQEPYNNKRIVREMPPYIIDDIRMDNPLIRKLIMEFDF